MEMAQAGQALRGEGLEVPAREQEQVLQSFQRSKGLDGFERGQCFEVE